MKTARSILGGALMATLGVGSMVAPTAAHAATVGDQASPPGATTTVKTFPLKHVGVDHAIAEAHGYEVRTDSSGIEYSVKKGSGMRPANTLPGDCGKSWVYFTAVDTSRHYSSIYTGFELNSGEAGAVDFDWTVHVKDNYGNSDKHWGNPLASEHFWAGTNGFTSAGPGSAFANVTTGLVIEWDGSVCYSHGPSDSAYL